MSVNRLSLSLNHSSEFVAGSKSRRREAAVRRCSSSASSRSLTDESTECSRESNSNSNNLLGLKNMDQSPESSRLWSRGVGPELGHSFLLDSDPSVVRLTQHASPSRKCLHWGVGAKSGHRFAEKRGKQTCTDRGTRSGHRSLST